MNNGISVDGDNINSGTQIGTQTLNQTVLTEDIANTPDEDLNLKPLPLFDIDDAVVYALSDGKDDGQIMERAKQSTVFIPSTSRALGVRVIYDLVGITPTPTNAGDGILVEPCLPPRDGDLVLLCLGHPHTKRGVMVRLFIDLHGNYSISDGKEEPQSIPKGSAICGVATKIERELIDGSIINSRINKEHKPIIIPVDCE